MIWLFKSVTVEDLSRWMAWYGKDNANTCLVIHSLSDTALCFHSFFPAP